MSIKDEMMKMMPLYYKQSKVLSDLFDVIEKALLNLNNDMSNENKNISIITTTEFAKHERDVGLGPIIADVETKRARVISRLQGTNVLTKTELRNIIFNYDKTGCEITEDYTNYTVSIKFTGRTGRPPNIEEIKTAIEEVKPAHIMITYEFKKNRWIDAKEIFGIWLNARKTSITWGGAKDYDNTVWLFVDENNDVYDIGENNANARLVFINGEPYARMLLGG